MLEIVRLLCTVIVHASLIMMTFSLFKIPLIKHHRQIAILAILVGGCNYLIRFQLESSMFLPASLVVFVVALMFLRGYPIAYSILVSLTGYALGSFIDELITYQIMIINDLTLQELLDSNIFYPLSNAAAAVACSLVALVFRWRNWGTSFIVSRFHGKFALRKNNYIWAAILISGLLTVQFGISSSLKIYNLIALGLFCIFGIIYTYRENKKIMKIRFPNGSKKKGESNGLGR